MNRPIRKTAVSIPTNITGPSRANTSVVGTPKLSGHHSMPRNIINVQPGIIKCIIHQLLFVNYSNYIVYIEY